MYSIAKSLSRILKIIQSNTHLPRLAGEGKVYFCPVIIIIIHTILHKIQYSDWYIDGHAENGGTVKGCKHGKWNRI